MLTDVDESETSVNVDLSNPRSTINVKIYLEKDLEICQDENMAFNARISNFINMDEFF